MIPPPEGVVTVVFAEAAAWAGAAAIPLGAGYEVKRVGDRLMAAFASAPDAVRFALDLLARGVDVRFGAHTGEAIREIDPATGRMDYFGPAVNRAARLMEAAHPGQVVLSRPALDAAGDALRDAAVTPLGEHRLKGLERPEPLFQVRPASLPARDFPPLLTLSAQPTNLPAQSTSFVGREAELRELERLFASGARLVTLTGLAGVGKTRLAVRLGAELLGRFAGGCWFADLEDAGSLGAAVAQALRLPEEGLGRALAARGEVLLVLDTWEAAGKGGGEILAKWLEGAPGLRVLATGRAATRLPGEKEVRVEPFEAPARGAGGDAARLFVERAKEAKPDFAVTAEAEDDIAAICRELEGIPLAIELAASRVKIMQPAMMRKKLGQKFQLLKTSRQDAARRQQTLGGAIEWGLETLTPEERRVFLKLSVFRGGFLADVAAAVIGPEASPEVIEGLRARSLLAARDYAWGRRYLLYRVVREYTEREWQASSTPAERLALERAHAEAGLAYAELHTARLAGGDGTDALDRLDAARDNLVAILERALGWAAAAASPAEAAPWLAAAIRAALALGEPAIHRGSTSEWVDRVAPLDRALAASRPAAALIKPGLETAFHLSLAAANRAWGRPDAVAASIQRAFDALTPDAPLDRQVSALRARAYEAAVRGRHAEADADIARAREISESSGRAGLIAEVENLSGTIARRRGDLVAALRHYEKAYTLAQGHRATGTWLTYATNLATGYKMLGRNDEALAVLETADRVARDTGRARSFAHGTLMRSTILLHRGDTQAALQAAEEAEVLLRDMSRPNLAATCFVSRGAALARLGRLPEALQDFDRAEEACRVTGDPMLLGALLSDRAEALAACREFSRAVDTLAAADAHFRKAGNRLSPVQALARRARWLTALGRVAEARAAIDQAEKEGSALSPVFRGQVRGENARVAAAEGRREDAAKFAREALEWVGAARFADLSEEERETRAVLETLVGREAPDRGEQRTTETRRHGDGEQ